MRGSAAVRVTVETFTVWNFSLALVGLAIVAAWAAWLVQLRVHWAASAAALALVAFGTACLSRPWWRLRPVVVRWDGAGWSVDPRDATAQASNRGALHVQCDCGVWLLLRFVPASLPSRGRAMWLPVQQQGSPGDWHALRCALYAPQPGAAARVPEAGKVGA